MILSLKLFNCSFLPLALLIKIHRCTRYPCEAMTPYSYIHILSSFASSSCNILYSIENQLQEERIETVRGSLLIAVQGDRTKPGIITYHDLGLNRNRTKYMDTLRVSINPFLLCLDVANFQAFCNFSEMRSLLQNFCVYHVNAPGQEERAATLPEG